MRVIGPTIALMLLATSAFAQDAAPQSPPNAAVKGMKQNTSSTPVAGANSFTMAQAKSQIEGKGYTKVSGLKKDDKGVWHGTATMNGNSGPVSLDYQGNVNAN
jgi:hypothetical protein